MEERKSFMNDDVTLKRWRLYALRFGLMVFGWTALKLGFLALITDASVRVFVVGTFVEGVIVAMVVSTAIYAIEANSKWARVLIAVVFVALAILVIADRIRTY
jgi:cadmium resistance protein CadD (predicted permease)